MRYRVEYCPDGWHPMTLQYANAPEQHRIGEWQTVRRDLGDGRRLYVQLVRYPGTAVQVAVARVEVPCTRLHRTHYRTMKFLQSDDLELIEVPEQPH